jgi:hypothetical protein
MDTQQTIEQSVNKNEMIWLVRKRVIDCRISGIAPSLCMRVCTMHKLPCAMSTVFG